ncbi:MAG TPA: aminoacyl-tRNA hydrolase [Candidatus Saccharimonadales bacterium]|nr:aminoacyl-tRNA hydrolase [Candidatus Saccharimonadales bacterium]
MKLIVGLGNPGEKYENTRHNLGFQTIDHFLKESLSAKDAVWSVNKKLKSEIAVLDINPSTSLGPDGKVILAKPQTFMNNSGMAVSLLLNFYKVKPVDLWLVYDELDLPVGSMKIRFGGAAAGHHGVESVMEKIGTDKFWRFRLGIGASHDKEHVISKQKINKAKEFVLGGFGKSDKGKVRELIKHGSDALKTGIEKGIEVAMNRYNTR